MSIMLAQERGSFVYVYDENNRHLFTKSGELHGYTSNSVTVKRGSVLYTYNEKGLQISSRCC